MSACVYCVVISSFNTSIQDPFLTGEKVPLTPKCDHRVPPPDLLFRHLANDLYHRRYEKEISDVIATEKWLGKVSRKKLQKVMAEIDRRIPCVGETPNC